MRNTAYINDLESLKKWFEACGHSFWVLVHGFHDGMTVNQKGTIYRQTNDDMSPQESWNLLAEMLEMHSSQGARFTIFTGGESGKNAGRYLSTKFQWGQSLLPGMVAGIAGLPSAPGTYSRDELAREIEKERRIWELERMVEDLSQPAPVSGIGGLLTEKLREVDFTPIISGVIGILGKMAEKAVGQAPVLAGSPADTAESDDQAGYQYEADKLLPILDKIRQHFETPEEFYSFIASLATKFNEAPAMYKGMLK